MTSERSGRQGLPRRREELIDLPGRDFSRVLSDQGDRKHSLQRQMKLIGKDAKFASFCNAMKPLVERYFRVTATFPNQDPLKRDAYYDEAKHHPLMTKYRFAWPVIAYATIYLTYPASRLTLKQPDPNVNQESDSGESDEDNFAPIRAPCRPNNCYVSLPSRRSVGRQRAKAAKPTGPGVKEVREFLSKLTPPQTPLLRLFFTIGIESRTELIGISRRESMRDATVAKLQEKGNLTAAQVRAIKQGFNALPRGL